MITFVKFLWSENDLGRVSETSTQIYDELLVFLGVLQPAAGAAEDEDTDSPLESEVPFVRETVRSH